MRGLIVVAFLAGTAPLAGQTTGIVEGRSKLFYESVGSGARTIVVVHGGPGLPHDYMRPEWDRLTKSGRVIYYDQNGCGKSGRVPPYGWRSHVEDLDRLINALAPTQRVVLAGSSWGSMLALYYAYEHPSRVMALVLSGVPVGITGGVGGNGRSAASAASTTPSSRWLDEQSWSRFDSVNRGLSVSKSKPRPPLASRLQERIKEDCSDIAGIINLSLPSAPRGRQLMTIAVPVLVVHGSNPGQQPGDGGPPLVNILPNAKLVTIANAGHDPWLDQPNEFFAAANEFLATLPKVH